MTVFDSLRKKEVSLTPEESVRQWFIAVLKELSKVPITMMKSEVAFNLGDKIFRADIVVYDRKLEPLMVVECKRESVDITEEVVAQALRYNSVLSVKYLVLTNRKNTYLYHLKDGSFVPLKQLPTYLEMIEQ